MRKYWLYSVRAFLGLVFSVQAIMRTIEYFDGEKGTKLYKETSNGMDNLSVIVCPLQYKSNLTILQDLPRISDGVNASFGDFVNSSTISLEGGKEFLYQLRPGNPVWCLSVRVPSLPAKEQKVWIWF